jgi:hypothetical protein
MPLNIAQFLKQGMVSLGLLLCLSSIAQAASIVVGDNLLIANTPGQVIDLYVSGSEQINALDLFMTINGGGLGPVVTAVDITGAGTIFAGNNTGMGLFGAPDNPPSTRIAVATTTASGTVLANGLLARVTFDTTGIPPGIYSWSLTNHPLGATDFGTDANFDFIYPQVTDGRVGGLFEYDSPEPSSLALCAIATIALGLAAIRNRAKHLGRPA